MYECPEIKFTSVHPTYAATPMVQPFRNELDSAKAYVLNPQVVADAIVKQILSGNGRQIILGADIGFLSGIRGWPHWLAQAIIHAAGGRVKLVEKGTEKTGG